MLKIFKPMEQFNLKPELMQRLKDYTIPTKIQSLVIPLAITGKSLIASSPTGTGKTLSFLIPTINHLLNSWTQNDGLGALILVPTHELALQVYSVLNKITNLPIGYAIGGMENPPPCAIIVGTPGRVLALLHSSLTIYNLQVLVIDEADMMLEMGFISDVREIIKQLNDDFQTMLFTATPRAVLRHLPDLNADFEIVSAETELQIEHIFMRVSLVQKTVALYEYLKVNNNCVVFFSTCKEVRFMQRLFQKLNITVYMLNGSMKQSRRNEEFNNFKNGGVLFCTDVGSRGIDFNVNSVLQYDCADSVEQYVHRTGRTGRNGNIGTCTTFVTGKEERIIEEFKKGKWKMEGEMRSDDFENNISIVEYELKRHGIRDIIQKSIKNDKMLEMNAIKYIQSYKRYMELSGKKYYRDSIESIVGLASFFGVTYENKKDKRVKNCSRKQEIYDK